MFETLANQSPQSMHLIDSSNIRAYQHAQAQKKGPDYAIGRPRGELSTKIHAVVDSDGLPVRLLLSPGRPSDTTDLQISNQLRLREIAGTKLDDEVPG